MLLEKWGDLNHRVYSKGWCIQRKTPLNKVVPHNCWRHLAINMFWFGLL